MIMFDMEYSSTLLEAVLPESCKTSTMWYIHPIYFVFVFLGLTHLIIKDFSTSIIYAIHDILFEFTINWCSKEQTCLHSFPLPVK